MDFDFTAEQTELRATVRRFAEQVVAPLSRQMDRERRLPPELLTGLADLGVLAMMLDSDDGGGSASSIDAGIAVEELARADFVTSQMPIMGSLSAYVLAQASPQLKEAVLPALIEGRSLIGFALMQPGSGSDALALRCRAERTATGYRLTGEKTSISNLGHAEGVIVLAKLSDPGPGHQVTAFFVPVDREGVGVSLFDDLGCRALTRGALVLDDVEVSEAERIGAEGTGFGLVMKIFDLTRTLIALAAVATATASVEDAAAYSWDRRSFGVPIASHQGVSFRLAEHATRLEAARWLCYRALWLRDAGHPHTTEAAMCKWWCLTVAVDAIHDAMLLHGHSAYTTELPHEQRFRDVIGMEWGDGTAQIQKLVIARSLIGRDAVDAEKE